MWEFIGRVLCWLGFHDFRVVDVTFGFGGGGSVERIECRRCGLATTRQAGVGAGIWATLESCSTCLKSVFPLA